MYKIIFLLVTSNKDVFSNLAWFCKEDINALKFESSFTENKVHLSFS